MQSLKKIHAWAQMQVPLWLEMKYVYIKKDKLFTVVHIFSFLHSMTFDLMSGLHMQIQTWHPPLRLCIHAKYYVKSGLTNVLKNANKTKNMHLFSIRIAIYWARNIPTADYTGL